MTVAMCSRSANIKFADDTTILGLITDNDETAYKVEVRDLAAWRQDNNLTLNTCKTKVMIMDFRKPQGGDRPFHARHLSHMVPEESTEFH